MKHLIFMTFALVLGIQSNAETCKMTLRDVNKIIVTKELKRSLAQAKAVEACVDLREQKYKELRGDVNEEQYDRIINSCSIQSCEN